MKKLMKTYQGLETYEGNANADQIITLAANNRIITHVGTSVEFYFKKQNKLRLNFKTSQGGRSVYCNGSQVISYDGVTMNYSNFQAGNDLKATREILAKRAGVGSVFDPLFFLSGVPIPANLVNLTMKPNEKLNDKPTMVLTGELKTPAQQVTLKDGKKATNPASTALWTWWIDKNTYLLSKIEMRVNKIPQVIIVVDKKDKKKRSLRQILTNLIIRQNITGVKSNGQIDEKLFAFAPPPGSKETKSADELIKLK